MELDLTIPFPDSPPTVEQFSDNFPLVGNLGIVSWWSNHEFDGITYTLRKSANNYNFRRIIIGCREFADTRYTTKRFRQCSGSHMKFYVDVDNASALITSANLVAPTLAEIGVIIIDPKTIKTLRKYFEKLWKSLKC